MDPISIGIGLAGLGLKLFGGSQSSDAAQKQAQISQQEAQQEQLINNQKTQQMQLQASRSQLENFRNTQRARAQGLATATSQGAAFGSGLQGGQAQALDQGTYNSLGISQNLQIGENINGINNTISGLKGQMASAQADASTAQGLSSLGGSLMGSANIFGSLAKNAGGSLGDPLSGFGGSSRWSLG